MPADLIRADYPGLERVAQSFDQEADRIHRLYEAVEYRLSRLKHGGWEGDNASEFYRVMDGNVVPAVQRLHQALADSSKTTREIILLLKAAEEEAAACLKNDHDSLTESVDAPASLMNQSDDQLTPVPALKVQYRKSAWQQTSPNNLEGWQAETYEQAVALGIDPVLAMMLVQNEINHLDMFDHGWYDLLWGIGGRSFGIAQVRTDTVRSLIEAYPEQFSDLVSLYPSIYHSDNTINEFELGWAMYENPEFSARMAVAYIAHNQAQIYSDLNGFGVVISETPFPGVATLTPEQVQQLVIVSYNTGWNNYHQRLQENRGPQDVANRLISTIESNRTHVNNVLSLEEDIETAVGQELELPPETVNVPP